MYRELCCRGWEGFYMLTTYCRHHSHLPTLDLRFIIQFVSSWPLICNVWRWPRMTRGSEIGGSPPILVIISKILFYLAMSLLDFSQFWNFPILSKCLIHCFGNFKSFLRHRLQFWHLSKCMIHCFGNLQSFLNVWRHTRNVTHSAL